MAIIEGRDPETVDNYGRKSRRSSPQTKPSENEPPTEDTDEHKE